MSSTAYAKFDKTIKRCETLLNTYNTLTADNNTHGVTIPKDIIRGAVVLTVSAVDSYVTDVFAEFFIKFLKSKPVDNATEELLQKAGLDTKVALEMLTMDRPFRRIRKLVDDYHAKYTTQKFQVIDEFFRIYGLPGITTRAEQKSGRTTLKRSVELLIQRRHDIAHNGDYNKHGRIKDIDGNVILRRIKDTERLVENMDFIICNKFR